MQKLQLPPIFYSENGIVEVNERVNIVMGQESACQYYCSMFNRKIRSLALKTKSLLHVGIAYI